MLDRADAPLVASGGATRGQYPDMAQQCHKKVRSFIKSARQRHWEATAKLGELMALLTAVDCKWSEVSSGVINEVLDRSWFWILRFHPELQSVSLDASGRRAVFGNSNLSNEELVDTGTGKGERGRCICVRDTGD